MVKSFRCFSILLFLRAFSVFLNAQEALPDAAALRDYVGLIRQNFHPEISALLEKIKDENRSVKGYARSIDQVMKGTAGSGFLVAVDLEDGKTGVFLLTNYHVISSAWGLTVTFIKQNGEKKAYGGLKVIAVDEELDLALLSFEDETVDAADLPGLRFLDRPLIEGEDVYTAGFPGLANESVWQFGRGMVSNAEVITSRGGDVEDTIGPFIQHTAQADPGNSGGPLLVHDPQTPAGFAVAGVNALSARRRQAANFAAPSDRAAAFIAAALKGEDASEARLPGVDVSLRNKQMLDEKLDSFLKIFEENEGPRYVKISAYLSISCIAENAVYAYYEALDRDFNYNGYIIPALARSPLTALGYAVSWTMESSIPSKTVKSEIVFMTRESETAYTVMLAFNKRKISTRWILEYDQWRLDSFGNINGSKDLVAGQEKRHRIWERLRDEDCGFHAGGGYVTILDRGPAYFASLGLGATGIRFYYADENYWQFEEYVEARLPWRFSVFSLALAVNLGFGFKKVPQINGDDWGIRLGLSPQLGLQFTSSVIPGLYAGAAYQFNWYFKDSADKGSDTHLFIFSAGYRFPSNSKRR
jgi:serine protease Do